MKYYFYLKTSVLANAVGDLSNLEVSFIWLVKVITGLDCASRTVPSCAPPLEQQPGHMVSEI